jgi:2-polyprenyl-6-hydroxyphenyl methylase/3-demethylubiquinone-9 3-methyltransferase
MVGADPAEKNIAAAKLHAGEGGLAIDYRATTAEALADAGERFDIVLAMEVVEHVADVKLFVARCAEMVRPGRADDRRHDQPHAEELRAGDRRRRIRAALAAARHASVGQVRHAGRARDCDGACRLRTTDERGVIYNLLADRWELSTDTDVNYMVLGERAS